jgi:hypothetical protein
MFETLQPFETILRNRVRGLLLRIQIFDNESPSTVMHYSAVYSAHMKTLFENKKSEQLAGRINF